MHITFDLLILPLFTTSFHGAPYGPSLAKPTSYKADTASYLGPLTLLAPASEARHPSRTRMHEYFDSIPFPRTTGLKTTSSTDNVLRAISNALYEQQAPVDIKEGEGIVRGVKNELKPKLCCSSL